MMKYFFGIALLLCFSCGNKEDILLPKSDRTITKEVVDLSPVYIFFRVKGKDTLAEVNRKNSIGTTNWVLNIDKRLPLRLVIPEVMKLQEKKRGDSAHKNEAAENYYSYADSIGRNLAFIPFTKVYYKMEKPKFSLTVFFNKNNKIFVDGSSGSHEELKLFLTSFPKEKLKIIRFCFDANMSYEMYIQSKIFVQGIEFSSPDLNFANEEFIY